MIDYMILLFIWLIAVCAQVTVLFVLFLILKKRHIIPLILAGLKSYGDLYFKFFPHRGVKIVYRSTPVDSLDWKVKDKATGKIKTFRTFITSTYHTIMGTAINLHLCPITYPYNVNALTKEKTRLGVEEMTSLMALEYAQGCKDTSNFSQGQGIDMDKVLVVLLGVAIAVLLFNTWLTYNMLTAIGSVGG